MLVLAVESHIPTLPWKSWKPLPRDFHLVLGCLRNQHFSFHVFQQREPWHCGLILLKKMLLLLPLLHLTSHDTLARPSQLMCCALFSSPKSMNSLLVAPTIPHPGGQGEIQAFLTFSFPPWETKLILPCYTLEGCCWD